MSETRVTHRDSSGALRVANRFGFNSFWSAKDVLRYARSVERPGKSVWIIELEDGTFDFTMAEPNPERPKELGGYVRTVVRART